MVVGYIEVFRFGEFELYAANLDSQIRSTSGYPAFQGHLVDFWHVVPDCQGGIAGHARYWQLGCLARYVNSITMQSLDDGLSAVD
jgi:hypothetical protein